MNTPDLLLYSVLALVGFVGSAVCSGLETGVYRVNRVRLAVRAAATPPDRAAARLQRELERPDRLLSSLLIGNNAFNYFGTLGITGLLGLAGLGDAAIVILTAVVITPLLLVFGESLPKEVFRLASDRFTPALAPFLVGSRRLYTAIGALPVVVVFGRWASRLIGAAPGGGVGGTSRERVATLLRESAGDGALSQAQSSLADRALRMGQLKLREEMRPWRVVRTVHLHQTRARVLARLGASPYSRVPVVDRRGRCVGVLRHLDALLEPDRPLADLVREPARLSGDEVLRLALIETAQSEAECVVIEDKGVPIGFATPKDLIEPLTGELTDW